MRLKNKNTQRNRKCDTNGVRGKCGSKMREITYEWHEDWSRTWGLSPAICTPVKKRESRIAGEVPYLINRGYSHIAGYGSIPDRLRSCRHCGILLLYVVLYIQYRVYYIRKRLIQMVLLYVFINLTPLLRAFRLNFTRSTYTAKMGASLNLLFKSRPPASNRCIW